MKIYANAINELPLSTPAHVIYLLNLFSFGFVV